MTVKDLYRLIGTASEIVSRHDLKPQYDNLIAYLNSMQSSPTQDTFRLITETIDAIKTTQKLIEAELLVLPHIEYLEQNTEMSDVLGIRASDELESIWRKSQNFSQPEVDQLSLRYSAFMTVLDHTLDSLKNFVDESEGFDDPLITFTFNGGAAVDTTGQLKYRLKDVEDILHGFARLSDDPAAFGSPQIRSMSKSSPAVIDILGAVSDTAQAFSTEIHLVMLAKGISWVLTKIEQIQNIQLNHEDLKHKRLTNEKIEQGFKELAAQELSDEAMDEFVNDIVTQAGKTDEESSGAPNEVKMAVKQSLRKLVILHQKGGTAKVFIPAKAIEQIEDETVDKTEIESLISAQAATQRRIAVQEERLAELGIGTASEASAEPEEVA